MPAFQHVFSTGSGLRRGLAAALWSLLPLPLLAQTAAAPAPAQPPAARHPALQAAAAQPGAVVTASGLVFRALEPGQGAAPKPTDVVRVHYRGTFPDGREFDSSYARSQPASLALNRDIPCWTEGLQLMKPGGRARLTGPADLASGARGAATGLIPPGAVLVFEVKLLAVTPAP
ncbi:MAG: FKBP-type peptidyl-prolyl cis-trans isomerase [Betaproteobacteria bacterium]